MPQCLQCGHGEDDIADIAQLNEQDSSLVCYKRGFSFDEHAVIPRLRASFEMPDEEADVGLTFLIQILLESQSRCQRDGGKKEVYA